MDSDCVELKFNDGSMIAINCTAVENEIADNMYQRSELDYLIYNDPLAYADLVLNGNALANLFSGFVRTLRFKRKPLMTGCFLMLRVDETNGIA